MKKQTIGQRIHLLRTNAKMSQAQLGEKVFVSNKTISKWENDLSEPNSDSIKQIAAIFNVTVNYLMTGEESKVDETTMTPYEVACKYDDITLLKDLDLNLPDAKGKDIFFYLREYHAREIWFYLYKKGITQKGSKSYEYDGRFVLIGKKPDSHEYSLLCISSSDEKIKETKEYYLSKYYYDLKSLSELGSYEDPSKDYGRLSFDIISNSGQKIAKFKIHMLSDADCSGLLEVKDIEERRLFREYISPNSYKKFLDSISEANLSSWEGKSYGMPIRNFLFSLVEKKEALRNVNYVSPSVDDYKRFLSALMTLVLECSRSSLRCKRLQSLINLDVEPYHFEGLNLLQSRRVFKEIETVAESCDVETMMYFMD